MWSSEKFGGNKEKRAATMCEFQRDRLHSPFTMATAQAMQRGDKTFQKELKDKCINVFDTVQKFMRQRNSLKIPQRLNELLTDCVQYECLRCVRPCVPACVRARQDVGVRGTCCATLCPSPH